MISEKIRTAQGMEGARRATGIPCAATAAQGAHSMPSLLVNPPDPEVPEKAVRRRFTAEYKLHILRQAEVCQEPGGVGALLRREGLYSSYLTTWRSQRDAGILSSLKPKQRGRKANPIHPFQAEVEQLRKENNRLQKRLKKAELIIDIQKKISQMLGIPLKNPEIGEDD
jgi:transposase